MKHTIKFSHSYRKVHGQTSAELLAVRQLHIDKNTPAELFAYDTTYETPEGEGRYPLKTGNYLQLIFLGDLRIPFCTIRPAWPPQKREYYESKIGQMFAIEIKEGGANAH